MLKGANVKRFRLLASLTPPFPLPILALTLTLGATRYQASLPDLSDPNFIAHYNDTGQSMVVSGVVIDFPDERDTYTNLRIETERLHPTDAVLGTQVKGLMLARVTPEKEFHYGDRITLASIRPLT